MTAPPAELSVQALVIVGGVAGGVFSVVNGAISLAKQAIATRKNGNGGRTADVRLIHDDIKTIDADIKECSGEIHNLTRAADSFTRSHELLKELLTELTRSNREFHQQFSIFLVKFGSHLEDFKCLRLTDDRGGDE